MSQGIESKKEGAIDQISKILVKLFQQPQKPSNTIQYMMRFLGVEESLDVDSLLQEFEKATEENIQLKQQIQKVKKQIEDIKGL